MQLYLFCFLLFFLPLIVLPFGISPFETSKVIFAEMGIEVLIFLAIIKNRKITFDFKVYIPFLLIFIISLFHLIFLRTNTTFFGNVFRLQGVLLLWHLLFFSILSSTINISKIPNLFYLISFGLLVSFAFILGGNENGRIFGTMGEPNALSAAIIFLWPFLFFKFSHKKYINFIFPIISFTVILLTGSRSGLIAFGIQLFFIFLTKPLKFSVSKSIAVSIVLILLSLILPFIEKGGIYENRSEIWQTAVFAGVNNFALGSGFGNIEQTLYKTSNLNLKNNVQYQYVDSSHNFILDWFVQAGILGLVLLLFMIIKTIKNFAKNKKLLDLTSLLGILTVMLFNPVSVATLIAFWWFIGKGQINK